MVDGIIPHRETEKYKIHIRKMIDESTVEIVDEEIGTYGYVCYKYMGDYIRVLNKETHNVHIIDKTTFEKKLRFYNTNFEEFLDKELTRINFTLWF